MKLKSIPARWGVGLFLLTLTCGVQGAPVWISTPIPNSLSSNLSFFASNGQDQLWFAFRIGPNLKVGKATVDGCSIDPTFPTLSTYSADLVVDQLGDPHFLVSIDTAPDKTYHVYRLDSKWVSEEIPVAPIVSFSLAKDKTNSLHAAFSIDKTDHYDVVYATHSNGHWLLETVGSFPNNGGSVLQTTLNIDPTGLPFLTITNKPLVKILKKIGPGWVEIYSLPFPHSKIALGIDAMDRLHLAYSPVHTPIQTQYMVLNSSGQIIPDLSHTYLLSDLIYNPYNLYDHVVDLAVDDSNQAHTTLASAYMAPPGEVNYFPADRAESLITQIALTGSQPFIVSQFPSFPIILTTLANPPGTAQAQEQTVHSLKWTFTPSPGSLFGHRLIRAADGLDISGLLVPGVTTFTQTGLAPNQSETLIARAVFPGGMFVDAPARTAHTLAVAPQDFRLSRPAGNTVSFSWTPSGNSPGTLYRLRLIPPIGDEIELETTNQSAQTKLWDPTVPFALSLAAVNADGVEAFVSTLTHAGQDGGATQFSFDLLNGLEVDIALQGSEAGPALAVTATPADSFPTAPLSFGAFTPAGVGFDIPTSQAVPSGQAVVLTLRYPEGRLRPTDPLALARYDPDRNQWIPLATQSDGAKRRLTASTRALGLFQVMVRTSPPTDVGDARVYPNPFHPTQHNFMAIQEVPAGTQVRILSPGGLLVREFTTSEANTTWDGRDGEGNPVHSGVYVLRLEQNGNVKSVRFVLERP